MSPKPSTTSQYDDRNDREDTELAYWESTYREQHTPRMSWRGPLVALAVMLITAAAILGVLWVAFSPNAARGAERATPAKTTGADTVTGDYRAATPHPIKAPTSLLRARQACPNTATLLECRAALVRAYQGNEWQRKQTLELARQMVGRLTDWTCIHQGEGSWTANTGNGYHGGLQMDWTFMRSYGRDMLRRHNGKGAEAWTPREQIIVAQRAYAQGRGYNPWPQTSRACGL